MSDTIYVYDTGIINRAAIPRLPLAEPTEDTCEGRCIQELRLALWRKAVGLQNNKKELDFTPSPLNWLVCRFSSSRTFPVYFLWIDEYQLFYGYRNFYNCYFSSSGIKINCRINVKISPPIMYKKLIPSIPTLRKTIHKTNIGNP